MADAVKLTIDGRSVEVPSGTTILGAAVKLCIHIPTLCFHPALEPIGACRVCVVDVEGADRPIASCQALAEEGKRIKTDTPEIVEIRNRLRI